MRTLTVLRYSSSGRPAGTTRVRSRGRLDAHCWPLLDCESAHSAFYGVDSGRRPAAIPPVVPGAVVLDTKVAPTWRPDLYRLPGISLEQEAGSRRASSGHSTKSATLFFVGQTPDHIIGEP
jgi:hypothetical protein